MQENHSNSLPYKRSFVKQILGSRSVCNNISAFRIFGCVDDDKVFVKEINKDITVGRAIAKNLVL